MVPKTKIYNLKTSPTSVIDEMDDFTEYSYIERYENGEIKYKETSDGWWCFIEMHEGLVLYIENSECT